MISPVPLLYVTVVTGHNTLGFNTRAAASAPVTHARHCASIQRTSCIDMPPEGFFSHLYAMTFRFIGTRPYTRAVVCSMPQNDSAATIQQSDIAKTVHSFQSSLFPSTSIAPFTPVVKQWDLINRLKHDILT
jgi:hypothetical protein